MKTYTLHGLLRESAATCPNKEAVVSRRQSLSYGQLEELSNRLACALRKHGVTPGARVAIVLNKSIESIVSVFGILKAGALYVPIDPYSPPGRMDHVIRHCAIECVITSMQNWPSVVSATDAGTPLKKVFMVGWKRDAAGRPGMPIEVVPWDAALQEGGAPLPEVAVVDTSPAYILHTSGSTGSPKGVVISHRNALAFVDMAAELFHLNQGDRVASHAPLHFDLSVFDIFGAIRSGATIVIAPEYLSTFPLMLAEFIAEQRITVWNSVASVLTLLADRGKLERLDFSALRLVHFSGDIMPVKYLRVLRRNMHNAAFYNIYGQTEANSSMFYPVSSIPDDDAWKIPIGRAFPNFEVFAVDQAGKIASRPGDEGELYVNSATVALGYWGDAERTAERFVPDPRRGFFRSTVYRTGDLVRVDKDGNFIFAGRKDHMIKSRGYRIELDEIELVMNSHPAVRQAAAIAVPDDILGNRIVAYVSVIAGQRLEVQDLLDFCAARLPKYMVPEVVEFLADMPLTGTGKIDRKSFARRNGQEKRAVPAPTEPLAEG